MLGPVVGPRDLNPLRCLYKCIGMSNIISVSTDCPLALLYLVVNNAASYVLSCRRFLPILTCLWKEHLPLPSIHFIPRTSSKHSWHSGIFSPKTPIYPKVTEISTHCKTFPLIAKHIRFPNRQDISKWRTTLSMFLLLHKHSKTVIALYSDL